MRSDQLIDQSRPYAHTVEMGDVKKVTVNLPAETLARAQQITGQGITPTIVDGLLEIARREQRSALRRLKGKIHLEIDLERTRR